MPLFLRKKLPDGSGYTMEEVTGQELGTVPLARPADPTLGTTAAKKRFRCKICKDTFAGRGVYSMHFARKHKDMVETKDSWQKYVESIDGTNSQ